MVYRLFLSHSSPTAESKARLQALATAIEDAADDEIAVLYDAEQIQAGDAWRERIAFMLHACHGAAVLLDEAAIESKWVLAEATFASIRHTHDATFACFPISFLDNAGLESATQARRAQRKALGDSDWSVASLTDIQFVRDKDVSTIAASIAEALRAKGLLHSDNPIDRLASELATLISTAPDDRIQDLATRMAAARSYLSGDRRRLAGLALVQRMLQCLRLAEVRWILNGFGLSFGDDKVEAILNLLWPLVLPIEACELLHRTRGEGGYAHASLRCRHPDDIVPLYIQRAHLSYRPPTCFAIANDDGTFENLQANLRIGWRTEHRSRIPNPSPQQVDASLNRHSAVYVWVPGTIDAEVLGRLEQVYPNVAFIVLHEEGEEPMALPPNVLPITPALTADAEAAIIEDYDDAMTSLTGGR